VLNESGREIRLTDAGLLSIHTENYHCSVPLLSRPTPDGTGRSSDQEPERASEQEAEREKWNAARSMAALFGLASSSVRTPADAPADPPAAVVSPWQVTFQTADGRANLIGVDTAAASFIRQRLHEMLLQHHRGRIESQCGPLPPALLEKAETP
jgi:hypothetical protein